MNLPCTDSSSTMDTNEGKWMYLKLLGTLQVEDSVALLLHQNTRRKCHTHLVEAGFLFEEHMGNFSPYSI